MSIQVGKIELNELANLVEFALNEDKGRAKHEVGFALLTFDFGPGGMINYTSNAQRLDMIKTMEELLENLKNNNPYDVPLEN